MPKPTPMEQVEILRASCCVAGADGETNSAEKAILQKLADRVGVGQASLNAMIDRANSDQNFCREQFRILKSNPQRTMAVLLETAMVDGTIQEIEKDVLKQLATNLEVPEDIFQTLVHEAGKLAGGN